MECEAVPNLMRVVPPTEVALEAVQSRGSLTLKKRVVLLREGGAEEIGSEKLPCLVELAGEKLDERRRKVSRPCVSASFRPGAPAAQ